MTITINPGITINAGVILSGGYAPPLVIANLLFDLDMKNYVSGTAWPDASINNHDFTFSGTPTVVNPGTNQAYWNNMSNVLVANSNDGAILPVGSYTKGAMIWSDGNFGGSNIISSSSNNDAFWTAATPYLNAGHNGAWSTIFSETPVPTNAWVYVTVTFDITNGWALYQNGEFLASNGDTTVFNGGSSTPQIGGFDNGNNFTGKIAAAHEYTRALTQAEIQQNYHHYLARYNGSTPA